jgi:hypothetical protein
MPFINKNRMSKSKMPPQLLEHFKKQEAKKEDGSDMSDKEKRKAALDKARKYQNRKKRKSEEE